MFGIIKLVEVVDEGLILPWITLLDDHDLLYGTRCRQEVCYGGVLVVVVVVLLHAHNKNNNYSTEY